MGAHLSNGLKQLVGSGVDSFSKLLLCQAVPAEQKERPVYERRIPQMCISLEALNRSAESYGSDIKTVVWSYLVPSGLPSGLRPVKRYVDKDPEVPTLIGSFTFKDGSIGRFRATTGELLSRTYVGGDGNVVHELHDEPVFDLLFPPNSVRNAPRTVFSALQRQRGAIVCDTFSCRVAEVTADSTHYYETVDCPDSPRLAFPSDTVLVGNRFILVADTSNNRVVQFDTESPEAPGKVLLSGLCRPTCLAFDDHLSTLYIVLLTTQVLAWRYGTPSDSLTQLDKSMIGEEASIQQFDSLGSGRLLASMRFESKNVAVILEPDFD